MFPKRYISYRRGYRSSPPRLRFARPRACSHFACIQEMFIQYLTEQGYNVVKSERKPRKTIQYKDLGK